MMDKVIALNNKKKSEAITISLELEKRNRPQLGNSLPHNFGFFFSFQTKLQELFKIKFSILTLLDGCTAPCTAAMDTFSTEVSLGVGGIIMRMGTQQQH